MKRREARLAQSEATRPTTRRPRAASPAEDARVAHIHPPQAPDHLPRTATATPPQRALARLLSSREGLRTAIVVREILGPPKALQRPEDDVLL